MEALPELLPAVQAELLDMVALVLAQRTFARTSPARRSALAAAIAAGAATRRICDKNINSLEMRFVKNQGFISARI